MKQYDVLVAGGGFAGSAAAIAAARRGQKVLLAEETNCLGGIACSGLVNPFMPYTTTGADGNRMTLSAGLFGEIVNRLHALTRELSGDECPYLKTPATTFSEEYLKILLNRMMQEAGVEVLFHTSIIAAKREGGTVGSVIVSNIDGLSEIKAKRFIDCTGDANLTVAAGFPTHLGRKADHLCQPMTLCFRVGDIDTDKFRENAKLMQDKYKEYKSRGEITNPREDVLSFKTLSKSVVHFNTTRVVKMNPVDAADVTKAEMIAREQVVEMITFLRREVPGCENALLLSTAMTIGKRESRMIDGEYVLNQEDLLAFTKFEDGIAACNYDIDIHNPEGSGTSHYYFPAGEYYTIPYRCLIPKGSDNLLVAGRCISSTHEAQASYRIMPTVTTIGEAAGIAAAIANENDVSVRDVDVNALRTALTDAGAFL